MSERGLARVFTAVNVGYDGSLVEVECNTSRGLPAFNIVGLANKSVGESRERVRAAITNSELTFPAKRITINLAPADLAKEGSHFDLPIAVSILMASGQLQKTIAKDVLLAGELALNGDLRPISGALTIAETARQNGFRSIILPTKNATQAALVRDINVVGITTLLDVLLHLNGEKIIAPTTVNKFESVVNVTTISPSIDDIRGQDFAKRALVIAAAGHHNLLFTGPPGAGKTMLARALANLLPTPTYEELFEITKIHSLDNPTGEIVATRPFRAPHHTASNVALIGGGNRAKPGEVSLAHHGVLFLDEIPEFNRSTIEALRQPLEDRVVHIARANARSTYPANFMLVATQNPCPCGYYGDPKHECACTQQMILNYQKKLSGPLLDRIDMVVAVARVPRKELFVENKGEPEEPKLRSKITAARSKQTARQQIPNARLTNKQLERYAKLSPQAQNILDSAADRFNLSARASFKTIRVARTIADLGGHSEIAPEDVAEALQYRQI